MFGAARWRGWKCAHSVGIAYLARKFTGANFVGGTALCLFGSFAGAIDVTDVAFGSALALEIVGCALLCRGILADAVEALIVAVTLAVLVQTAALIAIDGFRFILALSLFIAYFVTSARSRGVGSAALLCRGIRADAVEAFFGALTRASLVRAAALVAVLNTDRMQTHQTRVTPFGVAALSRVF